MEINFENFLFQKGPGFWKFNSSLNNDTVFVSRLRHLVNTFLQNSIVTDKQVKWELLKYEIKKFAINYSKNIAKLKRLNKLTLDQKLESMIKRNISQDSEEYKNIVKELDEYYEHEANGIRIRSKCNWYELGEKSTKYFLNLEKKNAKMSTILKLDNGNKILTKQKDVNSEI